MNDGDLIFLHCPDCGKLLFKAAAVESAVIYAWCKNCREEKRIPIYRGMKNKNK